MFVALVICGLMLAGSLVFADECPYCHQSYGAPAPGDESRVYALRRQHEAECGARMRSDNSSGSRRRSQGPDIGEMIRQQQEWEEAERQRQEAERRRQEELKQKAIQERIAAEQKRQREWEETKQRVASMLKGGSGELTLKGSQIELKPKGTDMFGLPMKTDTSGGVLTRTLSSAQYASGSEAENIRRALWLYQAAKRQTNPEDARFISEQADEALQGHPLRVEVPPAGATPEIQLTVADVEQFKQLTRNIEESKKEHQTIAAQLPPLIEKQTKAREQMAEVVGNLQAIQQAEKAAAAASKPAAEQKAVTQEPKTDTAKPDLKTEPEKADNKADEKEKQKEKEDLVRQMLELRKQMEATSRQVDELIKRRDQLEDAIAKNTDELHGFKGTGEVKPNVSK